MANIITAGNSTNGGTAISTDTSGTLNIVTGSGSGANAITIDASQNVTFANAITTTGSATVGGNLAITGTLTATGGVTGSLKLGTAVASTSGTSIDYTSLPTGINRITMMFAGVSTNGSSNHLVRLGTSGGILTSGYVGSAAQDGSAGQTLLTSGFMFANNSSSDLVSGQIILTHMGSNIWVATGWQGRENTAESVRIVYGRVNLSGVLDRIRYTTVNGTDTFDAGSINILYE
jgi:hypothetical protein